MFHTTIAHFPVVLKHDFPNEEENYIDEKIDEGQYKKRYRYDRDLRRPKNHKSQQFQPKQTIMNMNSGELFQKLLSNKSSKKAGSFVIKPKKKLNINNLHVAIYKVKQQKEILDAQIQLADKEKKLYKENDICLLANFGAIKYIVQQNLQATEEELVQHQHELKQKQIKRAGVPRTVRSAIDRPKSQPKLELPDENIEIEGKAYSIAYSQYLSQSNKLRPTSSISTVRPTSSTKVGSENQFEQYAGLRNLLFEQVKEENEDDHNIGYNIEQQQVFLNPSPSDSYYPSKGVKGSKVAGNYLYKGLHRVQSAATQPLNAEKKVFEQQIQRTGYSGSRPKTAFQYYGNKKFVSNVRQMDHLRIIEEIGRQENVLKQFQLFQSQIKKANSQMAKLTRIEKNSTCLGTRCRIKKKQKQQAINSMQITLTILLNTIPHLRSINLLNYFFNIREYQFQQYTQINDQVEQQPQINKQRYDKQRPMSAIPKVSKPKNIKSSIHRVNIDSNVFQQFGKMSISSEII